MRVGSLPHRTVSDKRGGELARPAVVESPEFSNGRQLKMGELERTVRNQLLKSPDCHLVQSPKRLRGIVRWATAADATTLTEVDSAARLSRRAGKQHWPDTAVCAPLALKPVPLQGAFVNSPGLTFAACIQVQPMIDEDSGRRKTSGRLKPTARK
jgi:hypothetical protein